MIFTAVLMAAAIAAEVKVDACAEGGRILPNPASVLTVWNGRGWTGRNEQAQWPIGEFVQYVELMTATGGQLSRDLFKDPADRGKLDDYDFTELVKSCREVLKFGAKPYLKLGNVPLKFTEDFDGGEFKMNIRPPADHLVHYRYMKACAAALKAEFGLASVRSWRYAVLTEADNIGWFQAKSRNRDETREEFFKLYDYTAKAFEEELGSGLVFGTHLLNPRDSKCSNFSVEGFVHHCAQGKNYATGKTGAPLGLLTISAYSVPDCDIPSSGKGYEMDLVTKTLAKYGFQNVVTGVDEGRIIVCSDGGRDRKDLQQRVVGHSYQAAYDVRITRELFDAGADYFAAWGYFSGADTVFGGIPSFSYFTARETAKFAGMKRLPLAVGGTIATNEQVDAVAAIAADGKSVRVMVSRFRDLLKFDKPGKVMLKVKLPSSFAGKQVTTETLTLDDRNNWFTDWYANRHRDGIGSKDFGWSGADPTILDANYGLLKPEHRELFEKKYLPKYRKIAEGVKPVAGSATVDRSGLLELPLEFVGNGAAFVRLILAEGFFSVTKTADGRWWAVDGKGEKTVIRGVDHVRYRGHYCEADGGVYHYREWNDAHYSSPAEWEQETLSRLKKWGFNMLGTGHDAPLRHRGMLHAWELNFGNSFGKPLDQNDERWIVPSRCAPCTAMPNVFHPDFPRFCDELAKKVCAPMREDRDLLGWFLDNELCWWGDGKPECGVYDRVMEKPAEHSARKAAEKFAAEHPELKGDKLKEAFLGFVAERYFEITIAAVKKHDPNHLILGCRFAGLGGAADIVWKTAGRYSDIVTFNCYPEADLDHNVMMIGKERMVDLFTKRYELVGKPMLITEWSFPAIDSGLPCTHGAGQRFKTQKERTQATELCAKTFLSLPFLVGYDYFMWVDEPYNGITKLFPENTNYGLVNEKGIPYPEITGMFERLHSEIGRWHSAALPAEKRYDLELVAATGRGDAIREVRLNGVNFGAFRTTLATRVDDVWRWSPSTEVEAVRRDGRTLTLKVSGEDGPVKFEMTAEFEQTREPGEFVARVTRIANRGGSAFEFGGVVLQEMAEFVKGPDTGIADLIHGVPNLWKAPKEAEWKAKDGRIYGARTLSPLCRKVSYFWYEPENRQHPDAVFEPYENRILRPGESLDLPHGYELNCYLKLEGQQ